MRVVPLNGEIIAPLATRNAAPKGAPKEVGPKRLVLEAAVVG
jgi:hypothetical protein